MKREIIDKLAPLLGFMRQEISWLFAIWGLYKDLFCVSEARITLMSDIAPDPFSIFQRSLFDAVIMSIMRLTDPAGKGNKANANLRQLIEQLQMVVSQNDSTRVAALLRDVDQACAKIRTQRNKWTAHRDLATVQQKRWLGPAKDLGRCDIDDAVQAIRALIDRIDSLMGDVHTLYDKVQMLSCADDLICALKKAVAFEQLEEAGSVDSSLWTKGRYKDA